MSSQLNDDGAGRVNLSNETTPLLATIEPEPIRDFVDPSRGNGESNTTEGDEDSKEETPLPKAQIILLCYTAVVEPIAFFGIFPYINFMIEKVGNVDKEEVGFYSGMIESLFSLTQMCVMISWGRVCIKFNAVMPGADGCDRLLIAGEENLRL